MSAQEATAVGRGELTCDFCKGTRPLADYTKVMKSYKTVEEGMEEYLAGYECPECETVEEM
jgi:hypothetical protein